MFVCFLFWLLALPLIVKLWTPLYREAFSWDERVIGAILLFLPVVGVIFWGLYFGRPSSHHPDQITPSTEYQGITGVGRAMWTMAETARQNASSPLARVHMPGSVRLAWNILRWPLFAGLIGVVVWFNVLLVR